MAKKAPPHAWKKGKSGNPKGRPTGAKSKTPRLRDLLDNWMDKNWWKNFVEGAATFEKREKVARLRAGLEPKEHEVKGNIRTRLHITVQDEVG